MNEKAYNYLVLKLLEYSEIQAERTTVMKYLATYLLLKLGGNDAPTADDIKVC